MYTLTRSQKEEDPVRFLTVASEEGGELEESFEADLEANARKCFRRDEEPTLLLS